MKPIEHSLSSTLSIQQKLINANHYYIDLARTRFDAHNELSIRYLKLPIIEHTIKGKKAGVAYLQEWKVNYNLEILIANEEDFLKQTVGHEIAHLVAFQLFGSRGHDKAWKYVMRQLGLEPNRCHSYDLSVITVKKHKKVIYKCNCKEHEIGLVRHKNLQENKNRYFTCYLCKGKLIYKEV